MFFLKKIFQKNLNIDEIEDLLFDNGVEPKFADLIISKIKENKSQKEDIKKVIKDVHKATDLEFRFEDSSLLWGINKMNKTPTNGRKVIIDNKFQFSIL